MLILNGYEVHKKLYQNNQFTIYRGLRLVDKQKVILKASTVAQPSFDDFATLQHEYQILRQLELPGIIKAYKLEKAYNQVVLILEDINGLSLKEFLHAQPHPLNLKNFFKIALQLVDTLGELHVKNIIHKDIKPNNIIINPKTLAVQLVDFSISSQLSQETTESLPVEHMQGTLAYLSPEQTGRMNRSVDYRADFYSLGVTFFELLTKQLPFPTNDILEIIYCHLAKEAALVSSINPNVPEMLAKLIAKLLAKLPEDRYKSAIGLKADLLECEAQWCSTNKIIEFPLGTNDISDHLVISQKLYGREKQITELLTAVDRIRKGTKELLLISGYSGIGKSSLVKEIYKSLTEKKGYLISGKYDQLQRSIPYSAIIEGFRKFIRRLLIEPEDYLESLKRKLIKAFGNNGQVIIEVIPELELIIGKQPPVCALSLTETQNRFIQVLHSLIKVIAQPDHPLVISLDDLQWIDSASLHFLQLLLTDRKLSHLLVIGTYRSNEVDDNHPLMFLQQYLEKHHTTISHVLLSPLSQENIFNLLKDSLNISDEENSQLANLLAMKTQGNPFFIIEFLKKLYDEHILYFSYQAHKWQYDLDKTKLLPATANVIELLSSRILELPQITQSTLKYAACIGHLFDLKTLALISEQSLSETANALLIASKAMFIAPIKPQTKIVESLALNAISAIDQRIEYRFMHDRIQQSAYQLIPASERQQVHLRIGRLLLKEYQRQNDEEQLFEIVNHYNQSISLLENAEKQQLAEYNLLAAKKARSSGAYQVAKEYLKTGLKLIESLNTKAGDPTRLAFAKELASCEYLTGHFKLAEKHLQSLLKNESNKIALLEIYKLYCEMLAANNKHNESLRLGLQALRSIKIYMPEKPMLAHILWRIFQINRKIGKNAIATLALAPMQSEEYQSIIALINQLLNSAYIVNQNLFLLLAYTNLYISLTHGYTEGTTFSCLIFAFTIMHALNKYKEAMDFVELYKNLISKQPTPNFAGKNNFILSLVINPWYLPLADSIDTFRESYHLCRDSGDLLYSHYSSIFMASTALIAGLPLPEVKKLLHNAINNMKKVKINDFIRIIHFWSYFIECLLNKTCKLEEIIEHERIILAEKNNTEIAIFYSQAIKLAFLLGYYDAASNFGQKYEKFGRFTLGMVTNVEANFYYALTITYSNQLTTKQFKTLKKIKKLFQRWAAWCPANYQAYLLILEAETAKINGQAVAAMTLYDQAIKVCEEQHILHLIALANELAARYSLYLNLAKTAKTYVIDAHYAYRQWGALSETSRLEELYPEYIRPMNEITTVNETGSSSSSTALLSIDILSLLKSSQIISSEIQLDKLLSNLLMILLQNAGAERCILLAKTDHNWYVQAEGTAEIQTINLNPADKLESRTDIAHSLIRYVQRTGEPIKIHNNDEFKPFIEQDSYLNKDKPRSLLVMPVTYQGKLKNILYLENTTTENVFTPQRIDMLQMLSTQAAISIENARLYYQATHDPLTGLANRSLLYQTFNQFVKQAADKHHIALFFFDMDNFKNINDTLGHDVGDKLLITLAERIKSCLGNTSLAARLGGDEFVAILLQQEVSKLSGIANCFLTAFNKPVHINNHEVNFSVSIGASVYPQDGESITALLNQADVALYHAKASGKNNYQFYTTKLGSQLKEKNSREVQLRQAWESEELCIYYQPIYSSHDHRLINFEALLRWNHPEQGFLEATKFIKLAENSGLIIPIGKWVLRKVCEQIKSWLDQGLAPVPIAVNISGLQFNEQLVSHLVHDILIETGVSAHYIELEFTESVFIEYNSKLTNEIAKLRKMGIKLILDDFGTYYSSLSYLRQFQLDKIKIDKSFIQDINKGVQAKELLTGIIALAHSLKLSIIAEGIENQEQLAFLEAKGVDALQGFYLSPPINYQDCTHELENALNSLR